MYCAVRSELVKQNQVREQHGGKADVFKVSCRNASFTFTLAKTVYPEIARGLDLAFCLLVECHNNNALV